MEALSGLKNQDTFHKNFLIIIFPSGLFFLTNAYNKIMYFSAKWAAGGKRAQSVERRFRPALVCTTQ